MAVRGGLNGSKLQWWKSLDNKTSVGLKHLSRRWSEMAQTIEVMCDEIKKKVKKERENGKVKERRSSVKGAT